MRETMARLTLSPLLLLQLLFLLLSSSSSSFSFAYQINVELLQEISSPTNGVLSNSPPFPPPSEFYSSTTRRVRLADGRTVVCKIPTLSDSLDLSGHFSEEFLFSSSSSTSSSSSGSLASGNETSVIDISNTGAADERLQALQDECAEYKTRFFLWQFCYKKYLRQFDDIFTAQEG